MPAEFSKLPSVRSLNAGERDQRGPATSTQCASLGLDVAAAWPLRAMSARGACGMSQPVRHYASGFHPTSNKETVCLVASLR